MNEMGTRIGPRKQPAAAAPMPGPRRWANFHDAPAHVKADRWRPVALGGLFVAGVSLLYLTATVVLPKAFEFAIWAWR